MTEGKMDDFEGHTPGPWTFEPPGPQDDCGRHHPAVIRGCEGGFLVMGLSREREIADARLIAAAPDLLAERDCLRAKAERLREALLNTASLDAARTLSDWVLIHAGDVSADGFAQVILGNPATTPAGEVEGIHPRLEIAWCIAALKAREFDKGER